MAIQRPISVQNLQTLQKESNHKITKKKTKFDLQLTFGQLLIFLSNNWQKLTTYPNPNIDPKT